MRSDEVEANVAAAVGAGGLGLQPLLNALVVEAVVASGQQNGQRLRLELHQTN